MQEFLQIMGYALLGWTIGMLLSLAFFAIFPAAGPAFGIAAVAA